MYPINELKLNEIGVAQYHNFPKMDFKSNDNVPPLE